MKAVPGSATIRARNASALRSPDWVSCNRKSGRSEEHTSELQSQSNLVCRLLLEKKKKYRCTIVFLATIASFHTHCQSNNRKLSSTYSEDPHLEITHTTCMSSVGYSLLI